MKLETLLQICEQDEPDISFDMFDSVPGLTLVIGGIVISVDDNPRFLSDLAEVAKQAEQALRRAQDAAHDEDMEERAAADELGGF